jgi:hypothetical protein
MSTCSKYLAKAPAADKPAHSRADDDRALTQLAHAAAMPRRR